MNRFSIFDRQFLSSKLGASALFSVLAMLAMNILVISQPALTGVDLAASSSAAITPIEGSAA